MAKLWFVNNKLQDMARMALNSQFETLVEQAAIKRFKDLGYEYLHGSQVSSDDRNDTTEVVLVK